MKFRTKLIAVTITIVLLVLLVFTVPNQPIIPEQLGKAQFVLAEWDYPDEYGQGIEAFEIFENSTGSWVQVGPAYGYEDNYVHDWNTSVSIKLRCYTWFNSTLTGAIDAADGKNYQRHNITVTNIGNTTFSQQNLTYFYSDDSIDPPMWYYGYEVVLNFLPVSGNIYIVTVIYEVFY